MAEVGRRINRGAIIYSIPRCLYCYLSPHEDRVLVARTGFQPLGECVRMLSFHYRQAFCSTSSNSALSATGTTVTRSSLPGSYIFVKRGTSNLVVEARTQAYFYGQAQQSHSAPRVARVYEVFDDGRGSAYLLMEFISASSFEALINAALSSPERESLRATAITKIADAVE